jgi:uncharacterized alpha-E superfamily protein
LSVYTKPLLSRVADSVYWTGRYLERAENVARFIGVNLNLQLDLPLEAAQQWQPLIDTSGDSAIFKERYGDATQENVVWFLTFDADNPNSIYSCLTAARENARSVRETISSEMWQQINRMYLDLHSMREMPDPEALPDLFRNIRLGAHLFQGLTDGTLTHNESYHFLRLGSRLERADKTSRILDVKFFMLLPSLRDIGSPYVDIQWSAVLRSVSGFEMYRKKYGRIKPRDIVEFLVLDREFTRSIHYCVRSADESLHAITGVPMGSYQFGSEQTVGLLRSELNFTSVDSIISHGLHEYLDRLQQRLNKIDSRVNDDFVARTREERSQAQDQEATL